MVKVYVGERQISNINFTGSVILFSVTKTQDTAVWGGQLGGSRAQVICYTMNQNGTITLVDNIICTKINNIKLN